MSSVNVTTTFLVLNQKEKNKLKNALFEFDYVMTNDNWFEVVFMF